MPALIQSFAVSIKCFQIGVNIYFNVEVVFFGKESLLTDVTFRERPVATAKAHVMLYDTKTSSWNYSGSSQGLAKVQLYFNSQTNAYRIVGWSLQDREVHLNLKYSNIKFYHCFSVLIYVLNHSISLLLIGL